MASLRERFQYIFSDKKNLKYLILTKLSRLFDDETYIKMVFKLGCDYSPNLKNPQTFNEKLAWLKLYHRKPVLTIMADKYAVKKFVEDRVGAEYVVPNYGVWDSFEDIDFDKLPNQFVLKGTHDSGGATICRDKATFDFKNARQVLSKQLKRDFFYAGREWPYKNIPHRILADQLLDDHTGNELRDYKFWCFNGQPKYMYCTVKAKQIFENFYDMDFKPVNIDHRFPRHQPEFEKPAGFETMKELAAKLSVGIPFVRVDFFMVEGKVFFGEFTFFDWGGNRAFKSYEQDLELGQLIDLSGVISE